MSDNDLSSFIEEITGESYLRVQENLGDGFVRLKAREAQRRQAKQDITCFEDVILELLRNARDAHATAIFIAIWKEQDRRFITVIDNGTGIPEHLHETVFEPFVTSKLDTFHEDRWGVHGRGMALYSIKENVEKASVLYSHQGTGTSLSVRALTSDLPEKTDQSSLPYLHRSNEGEFVMRGPRNIVRVAMEFALDAKDELTIYLGSPVEIAATLLDFSAEENSVVQAKSNDLEAVVDFLKYIHDPDLFSERAAQIGLPLSSRSARRIINGQIAPLDPLLKSLGMESSRGKIDNDTTANQVDKQKTQDSSSLDNLYTEQRKLKIATEDLENFRALINEAFNELCERYYLQAEDQPNIRAGSSKITITIPFKMEH